jgi:hypothetical protein
MLKFHQYDFDPETETISLADFCKSILSCVNFNNVKTYLKRLEKLNLKVRQTN